MKHVSNLFKKELNNGNRHYVKSCDIVLANGTVLEITNKHTWQNGFSVESVVSSDGTFDIGSALIDGFRLSLNNIYDEFSEYVFEDAVINNVKIGIRFEDETIEYVKYGVFNVNEAAYNGSIITLNCVDNMAKFDRDYSESNLVYPATLLQIVQDACNRCGVSMSADMAQFRNRNYVVQNRPDPDNLTFRKVLAWVAQICGIWFKCNEDGALTERHIDAFRANELYENKEINGSDCHHFAHILNTTFAGDDVVITGIRVVEKAESEDNVYLEGSEGYVLSIEENELVQNGEGSNIANWLGELFNGLRFRPLSISTLSDPTVEAGDYAFVTDRKGEVFFTIITRTKFTPGDYQKIECTAESPLRHSASQYSQETRIYQELRKNIKKNKTEFEKAIDEIAGKLAQTEGAYTTVKSIDGGGSIFYLHNKPKVDESDMIWEMTAEAWRVTTDGGKTWNAGMTVDGVVIAKILNTIGINADWINTGALVVKDKDGKIIFSADMDTKSVFISGDNVQIGDRTLNVIISDTIQQTEDVKKEQNLLNDDFVHVGTLASDQSDPDGGTAAVKLVATGSDCYYSANSATNKPIKSTGQIYTFSVWLKASKKTNVIISLNHTNGIRQDVELTTSWKRYTISTKVESITPYNHVTIGGWGSFSTSNGADIYIYKPTVNYGTIVPGEVLTQEEVYNLLTNNGASKGVYMVNGELFINATYIETGSLAGWRIDKEEQTLTSPNGIIVIDAEEEIISINGVKLKAYGQGLMVSNGLTIECGNDVFSDGTDGFQILNLGNRSGGNYLRINNGYVSQSESSSRRYKEVGRVISDEDLKNWYNIQPVWAKYKDGYLMEGDAREGVFYPMFIAENVQEFLPLAVDCLDNGKAENWNERVLIPVMFQMLKSQKKQIEDLQKQLTL